MFFIENEGKNELKMIIFGLNFTLFSLILDK